MKVGMKMELMIDSADVTAIKKIMEYIPIDGITTNPTILANSKKDYKKVINELLELLEDNQKLFIQLVSQDYNGMMKEIEYINSLCNKNIYVKIPVTKEGYKVINECKKNSVKVLATAIYTTEQGVLAALAGADYLAPYVNRMENYGNGIQKIDDLVTILKLQNIDAKVIAASFKNINQVNSVLKSGVSAVTLAVNIIDEMLDNAHTISAVEQFAANWKAQYSSEKL